MKYNFEIILDKQSDLWNWLTAAQDKTNFGYSRRDQLDDSFKSFYDKIVLMSEEEARESISEFLDNLYGQDQDIIHSNKKKLKKELSKKFNAACEWLEQTTKRPLYFKEYYIWLTTFPRCPYDPDKGYFWYNVYWRNGIVKTFLHEVLHFQFIKYWRENPDSKVSKLPEAQFELFKESLTVIIDEEIIDLTGSIDGGYPSHQAFRKVLHKEWRKHHDFDELVDFGLQRLPK